jgi:hypothetical protein
VVGRSSRPGTASLAADLFHAALPAVNEMTSPRAWAYTLLGVDEYLRAFAGDRGVERQRGELAKRLLGLYQRTSGPDWPWFEERVTYCNARLPQALIVSGARMANPTMLAAGLAALDWLVAIQRREGHFADRPNGSSNVGKRSPRSKAG